MRVLKLPATILATTLAALFFAGAATAAPGDVIVLYKDDITRGQAQDVRAKAEVRALDKLNLKQRVRIQLVEPRGYLSAAETAELLKQDPRVLTAMPDAVARKALPEQDTYISQDTNDTYSQWGLYSADVFNAWRGKSFNEVSVAVVDTGVQRTHPDLSAATWVNPGEIPDDGIDNDGNGYIDDIYGWDWVQSDSDPSDVDGHGTHVAGTIGATIDNGIGIAGVAPNAKIASLRTLGDDGSGSFYDIYLALIYAGENGFDVVNGSLGGAIGENSFFEHIYTDYPDTLYVFAAGNSGVDNDAATSKFYPCTTDAANVVCVAAVNASDTLASFSNYGATSVDLAAPGVSIISTYPIDSYAMTSGTSMASPHVAGVAALARGIAPTVTPSELRQILIETGYPSASLSGKTISGKTLSASQVLGELVTPVLIGEPSLLNAGGQITASSYGDWSGEVEITEAILERNNGTNGWLDTGFNLVDPDDFAASAYTIDSNEEGSAFRLRVQALNGAGVSTTYSNIISFGSIPDALGQPQITYESPVGVGTLLTTSHGDWRYSPSSFDYIWERSSSAGGPWNAINGANATTYTVTEADRGTYIRTRVSASNYHGVGESASLSTSPSAKSGYSGAR